MDLITELVIHFARYDHIFYVLLLDPLLIGIFVLLLDYMSTKISVARAFKYFRGY